MRNITAPMQNDKLEFIKNPVVVEFLGLCSETSEDMARYPILKENKQLFQAKYLTYLPTEEELRQEIERQKEIYTEQQEGKKLKGL